MRAHCVRARFRDRSRPCFIACAFDVHATFTHLIVAERARPCSSGPGELLTALSWRGQCGSFRCKTVSTASVRKGAMTRRRALQPLFSPCKTRSVEYRDTVFLVALHTGKESVKGTLLPRLINIVVVRRQEDVGLLRTDRPPLTPFADEKKVRSFTACDDVYSWSPDSGSGAEWQ